MGQNKKSVWKLECVKEEIKIKFWKYLESNQTKHSVLNLWDATILLTGKFTALHIYLLKNNISIKQPNFTLQLTRKILGPKLAK